MTKRRSAKRKPLTLAQRVRILEDHCDGLIRQCQLELDTRLKKLEELVRFLDRVRIDQAARARPYPPHALGTPRQPVAGTKLPPRIRRVIR